MPWCMMVYNAVDGEDTGIYEVCKEGYFYKAEVKGRELGEEIRVMYRYSRHDRRKRGVAVDDAVGIMSCTLVSICARGQEGVDVQLEPNVRLLKVLENCSRRRRTFSPRPDGNAAAEIGGDVPS